jgi:Fic family protein
MNSARPPFAITPAMLGLVAEIGEMVGQLELTSPLHATPLLRRNNRIRTIQGSLAIEGNTLNLDQVTAIIDGKRVLGPPREIQEVRNAVRAYEQLRQWRPGARRHLRAAHALLMAGLTDTPGAFRTGSVGIQRGQAVVHVAPPAVKVTALMNALLHWQDTTQDHPLIASSVFHYEFEFIHPFNDGNGRVGRPCARPTPRGRPRPSWNSC